MDYVEQLQSLDETAGRQVIFDALNTAALAALSDMKNESTTTNNKKLDVFHDNELVHTTSNAKTKQEAIKQAKLKYPEKTGRWAVAVHSVFYGDDKKLTKEDTDQLDESRVIALLKAAKQLGYKHYKDIPEESDDMVKLQELSTKFQNDEEKPVTKEDLDESVIVHVKAYGSKPDKKDNDHVKSGVELHNGTYDGHSSKGSYFKFKDEESAKKFKSHVDKSPNKTTFADILSESTQLDEARKIDQFENGIHKATVHKDSDTGEYKVKFHTNGKHLKDADYFTDDKADAIGTAKHQISKMKPDSGFVNKAE